MNEVLLMEEKKEKALLVGLNITSTARKIDDIDIGVINGTPFVVIETDSLFTDKAWEEFNKKAYNDVAKDIADEIRAALDTKAEVNITLILDKEFGKDKVLSEAQY